MIAAKITAAIGSLVWPLLLVAFKINTCCLASEDIEGNASWSIALRRADIYSDCGLNAGRLLHGWIDLKQDPTTGLFSRGGTWDYHNEAADHYSSLVLVAFHLDPSLNQGGNPLHRTLISSRELCATSSGIPTTYDLKNHTPGDVASLASLSEWLRDGLIRICEVKGTDNDWYREMVRLVDAMLQAANQAGGTASAFSGPETAGNMLQTLVRLHAMSGHPKYLQAAEDIADAVFFEQGLSARDVAFLDHGCELVPGLGELLALEHKLDRPQAKRYQRPMQRLLDEVLLLSAHPKTGLFCESTKTGAVRRRQPPDTWGYVLFAYQNYDLATGGNRYGPAVEKPMRWLVANRSAYDDLKDTLWPRSTSSDDWSDSHESMIVLWNRYRHVDGVFDWLDWATLRHKHRRGRDKKYGPFDGGHFDGSTGRSLAMHMMVCSQGVRILPFVEGIGAGGVPQGDGLLLALKAKSAWTGTVCFDRPRGVFPTANIDWARLNEMPQWFVVQPHGDYRVTVDNKAPKRITGRQLIDGLRIEIGANDLKRVFVEPLDAHATSPPTPTPTVERQSPRPSR